MGNSVVSLPELGNGARAKSLTLRIERDLCYECAHEVVAAVRYLISRPTDEIVVELGRVNMIDSSGLRTLLTSQVICEEAGIGFRLTKISECVERIIRLSGLGHLLGLPEPSHAAYVRRPGVCLGPAVWKHYEHVAASNPALIAVLRDKVTAAAEAAGADGDVLCDIKIAVGEALTNAYRHGSPHKGVSRIEVRCMTCSSAFVVEIQDEGAPFNPDDTPEPDPKKLNDHGMGIYLMRKAMDVVEFSSNSSGTLVRMVKWLGSEDQPQGASITAKPPTPPLNCAKGTALPP